MMALEGMPIAEDKGVPEYEFLWKDLDYPAVHGFLDLVRMDADGNPSYGKEFKYSTNPDGWSKFTLYNQLGTYFIGLPVQRIEVVVFKVPYLKMSTKGKNKETWEEFRDRVYEDVKTHPREYVNSQSFFRGEFDLEEVKKRYQVITKELYDRLEGGKDSFYMTDNRMTCFNCDFKEICENDGIVSEQLYKKKERRGINDSKDEVK
jgi:hypothetical protein